MRTIHQLVVVLLSAFVLSATVSADVVWVDLFKSKTWNQTSVIPPSEPPSFHVSAGVRVDHPGDITGASMSYGGPQTPLNMQEISPLDYRYWSPSYSDEAAFDAAFPYGVEYTANLSGGSLGGAQNSFVDLPGPRFPQEIPAFDSTTVNALSNVDPNRDLTISWTSGFAPVPDAEVSQVWLNIWENGTNVYNVARPPNWSRQQIPAGTLQPGREYVAEVVYSTRYVTPDFLEGGTLWQVFDSRTSASLTTTGDVGADSDYLGDQATCDGANAPPVGSFFDPALWSNGSPGLNGQATFRIHDTSGDPSASTQFSHPRRIHFGEIDVAPLAGCINRHYYPENDGLIAAMEIEDGSWTFDFGPFDNYSGVGNVDATGRGSLTVSSQTRVAGQLRIQDGTLSSNRVVVENTSSSGLSQPSAMLEIAENGTLSASEVVVGQRGVLKGEGMLNGDVVFLGGSIAGELLIDGSVIVPSGQELVSFVGEANAVSTSVTGVSEIDGKVVLDFGFAPSAGQTLVSLGGFSVTEGTPEVEIRNLVDDFQADVAVVGNKLVIGAMTDGTLLCDFTVDGACREDDIDQLFALGDLRTGVSVPKGSERFDLNGDGILDLQDRDEWLHSASLANGLDSDHLVGDANLDGVVDGPDFVAWNDNKFTSNSAWSDGDFNGDGLVDGQDFVLWNNNKFLSALPPAPVPEPTASCLLSLGILLGARPRRP